MKSKRHKMLHAVCGKPMVGHVIDVLQSVQVSRCVVVVGHGAEEVQAYIGDESEYALQDQQLGTGHAVMQASDLLGTLDGVTIVICGDTPLITEQSLRKLIESHQQNEASATILSAHV